MIRETNAVCPFSVVSLVLCDDCEQLVPVDQASLVRMVEEAGQRDDGVKVLRATGETRYECATCFSAWFEAQMVGGACDDDDDDDDDDDAA